MSVLSDTSFCMITVEFEERTSLKFRPIAENKVVVKRLVYALTDELRTDYQQCMEQAATWSKYVIPAYSF